MLEVFFILDRVANVVRCYMYVVDASNLLLSLVSGYFQRSSFRTIHMIKYFYRHNIIDIYTIVNNYLFLTRTKLSNLLLLTLLDFRLSFDLESVT